MNFIGDIIIYTRPNSVMLNKLVTEGSPTPTLHGEEFFGFKTFKQWIDNRAMDIIHPDMLTSGGILETKKIADYANMNGIPVMFHMAGSPIGAIASCYCVCLVDDFYAVPEKPGLGIEMNDEVWKEHLTVPG